MAGPARPARPARLLVANLRLTDHAKDHEIDIAVVMPGEGVVVLEVKGSGLRHDGRRWLMPRNGREAPVDPVKQARDAKYALRSFVTGDPRWGSRGSIRWVHAVAAPYVAFDDDFALPDCPRWAVVDRTETPQVVARLHEALRQQETHHRAPDADDVRLIAEILAGRNLPQRDLIGESAEREEIADQLTTEQAVILDAIRLLPRVEVRGGAGSGKTWLAVEQARRLGHAGHRVALLCYSRGLAAYLQRRVGTFGRRAVTTTATTGSSGCRARW